MGPFVTVAAAWSSYGNGREVNVAAQKNTLRKLQLWLWLGRELQLGLRLRLQL